jgi:hypothetical protein
LPKEQQPTREFEEGSGMEWNGAKGDKGFEESFLPQNDTDKIDTRFTGKEGEIRRNEEEAKSKRALENQKLSRPEALQGKDDQPIPLEYRDILEGGRGR